MTVDDILFINDVIKIIVPATYHKLSREFVIANSARCDVDVVEIVKRYISLRPNAISNSRIFINYRDGKCKRQPIGINTISTFPEKIATFLGLSCPNEYTGHCFRRSSASFLDDVGMDRSILKRLECWPSGGVSHSFEGNSSNSKRKTSNHAPGQKIVKFDAQPLPATLTRKSSMHEGNANENLSAKNAPYSITM